MAISGDILTLENKREIIQGVIDRFLIPKFLELNMNASGEWISSLEIRDSSIWGRDYSEYLIRGRGPNQNQDPQALKAWVGYYGSTVLAEWVRNKGLNINPFAVAWKIAREGTRFHPEGTDLLEVLESKPVIDFISEKVKNFAQIQVELQVKRDLKVFR